MRKNIDKTANTFGPSRWSYESENIEELPRGLFSVGIGLHLMAETKLNGREVLALLDGFLQGLESEPLAFWKVGIGNVVAYVFKRGKAVEIGTRQDMRDIKCGDLCDILDRSI